MILLSFNWPRNRFTKNAAAYVTIAVNIVIWCLVAASVTFGARHGWSAAR